MGVHSSTTRNTADGGNMNNEGRAQNQDDHPAERPRSNDNDEEELESDDSDSGEDVTLLRKKQVSASRENSQRKDPTVTSDVNETDDTKYIISKVAPEITKITVIENSAVKDSKDVTTKETKNTYNLRSKSRLAVGTKSNVTSASTSTSKPQTVNTETTDQEATNTDSVRAKKVSTGNGNEEGPPEKKKKLTKDQ